jgi:lipoprotein-releasing system ATP-binding protein
LKGLDLHIQKGEFVSIVGASGSGKTTLLQLLGTLEKNESGTIKMMNFYVNRQKEYSRGYLLLRAFFGVLYIGIPHGFLLLFLLIGAAFVNVITFWIILFTGKYPYWSWNYNVKLLRYSMRVNAALSNLTDVYPEFGLEGSHPEMDFDLPYQEQQSIGRLLLRVFFGVLMLIPHCFVLLFLGIGTTFVGLIAFFAILFTGKYPEGMFNFVVRTWRWQFRVSCWSTFFTDGYPKFTGRILEGENQNSEQQSIGKKTVSGTIEIDNKNIQSLSDKQLSVFRNQKIGFVFQFHNLLAEFSALENVCLPAFIAGKSKKEAEQKATEILTMLGMENRLSHKPNELSGGEQQRVAVGRALINSPAIILADEPSGNLDSKNAKDLHQLLLKLNRETGQTIVIVTHNIELANMADRKLEIVDGKLIS